MRGHILTRSHLKYRPIGWLPRVHERAYCLPIGLAIPTNPWGLQHETTESYVVAPSFINARHILTRSRLKYWTRGWFSRAHKRALLFLPTGFAIPTNRIVCVAPPIVYCLGASFDKVAPQVSDKGWSARAQTRTLLRMRNTKKLHGTCSRQFSLMGGHIFARSHLIYRTRGWCSRVHKRTLFHP